MMNESLLHSIRIDGQNTLFPKSYSGLPGSYRDMHSTSLQDTVSFLSGYFDNGYEIPDAC